MAKDRIQGFFNNEVESLLSRYQQIELLIPKLQVTKEGEQYKGSDHPAEEGRFIESVLRTILNKYLPKNLKALSGFILRPEVKIGDDDNIRKEDNLGDEHSRQFDIIVYDVGHYPMYEQFEEFAIVPPEGVISIISIKKTLRKQHIKHELEALMDGASLCRHYVRDTVSMLERGYKTVPVVAPSTMLIGFTSDWGGKTTEEIISEIIEEFILKRPDLPYDGIINLICVLDRFSILRANPRFLPKSTKLRVPFISYKHNYEKDTYFDVGIQLILRNILKCYYDRTRSPNVVKPGFEKLMSEIFKIKEFNDKLIVNELRITKPINTIFAAHRREIRQKLMKAPNI